MTENPGTPTTVRRLIAALAPREGVTAETLREEQRLVDDLEFDSVGLIDLTVGLERAVGMPRQPEEELADVRTVGDVLALVKRTTPTGGTA